MTKRLFAILVLISCLSFSQEAKVYEGVLRDEKDKTTIPFAHFQGEGYGFISDKQGRFNIKMDRPTDSLKFLISAIGYASKEVFLKSSKGNLIYLLPKNISLGEIILDYENPALVLINKVIDNIPINYPTQFEQLYGEFNENTYWDSLNTKPIYKANATIRADKFSYSKKNSLGNVELLRKNIRYYDFDSLGIRFYGGVHRVHYADFVKARKDILSKNKAKKYEIRINDTLSFKDMNVAKLSFQNKHVRGTVYINLENYALVRVERHIDPVTIKNPLGFLKNYQRTYYHEVIDYSRGIDDKWRINFMHYTTGFKIKRQNKEIHLDDTFFLEKAQKGMTVIPENKRILYSDVLLNKIDFDSIESPNKREKLFRVLSRFRFSISLSIIPFSINQYNLVSPELGLNKTETDRKDYEVVFDFQNDFKIKNNWGLRISSTSSFNKRRFENTGLGVWKEGEINLNGRWSYGLSTLMEYRKLRADRNEITLDETFFYKNKSFDSGHIEYFSEQRDFGLSIGLGLYYQWRKNTIIGFYGSYFHSLDGQYGLFLQEKNEFWFWNKARIFDKKAISSVHDRILENNFQFGIKYIFRF